ncbi:hypothetical protein CYMTET_5652 [Cymbomonas tetramitiformis]|uniref:Uncharacterized protein n=1 Tax=Cymbomonas tetramitiformis TaxID=36881 RepID=A0AAE0LIM9_9CHLO|nr:hypothetical protein CYMTET_5652 [Cymbomonas tetramitiformis]
MFGHAQRSTKDLAADRSNETTFIFGSGIEASRVQLKAYLEKISRTDHGMRTILSTDGSQGCSACGLIRNLDQHTHGEATSSTKYIDFFHRRTDLPLPWQRFASQYTLDMANGMHLLHGETDVHKIHTLFVQHLMGSGKSDVLFNIVRLLCPKGEVGRPIHRVYIISEKPQKDFFDTFAAMIDVRHNTGTYNSPFVKYAKLEKNGWQHKGYRGSDPALTVEDSYAQILPSPTVATINTDLNRFYAHAKQKIDARSVSADTRYESLVFVFDEAHMFTASEDHMNALTEFVRTLKELGVGSENPSVRKPMNVIFVMLSGTLLTDSASREKWDNYLTALKRMYGEENSTFAVSYLDELPLALRPKYEFCSLPHRNGMRDTLKRLADVMKPKPQYMSTHKKTAYDAVLAACMHNLRKLLHWIVRKHERGQSHKYLLFLPTIKDKLDKSVDPLRCEQTRSHIIRMFADVQSEVNSDSWITSESSIAYDNRMQRVIDGNPYICYGIAKPGDSEYNDVLMRRFGRVKDAESDVNIDKLESDIEHLQLLITTTCTTGADFLGVSHVYFVGTPANKTEFRQNMYRAIRMCSHPLPSMQAGVKICTIGFDQTHEVCQNTIDPSDKIHRKFMANCIDAELDEHTGKVASLYTVNAHSMTYAGKPLSAYEEYDRTLCGDVAKLQDNRILKIRGDPYRYAPQFVVDDEETLINFLRYTILPLPSVIRFVKDYKQASDVEKKMAVVLRYYYRENSSSDATHDAGTPPCRAFEKSEPLSEMNRLLTTEYASIHGRCYPDGTPEKNVLKFLVSVLALSREATAVNLTVGEWLESDHLAMLRILDTIVHDVGNSVRNQYAYITDDDARVVQYDTSRHIKTSLLINTLDAPTVAILKEHGSKQNLCATVAKNVFVRLNKLRVKVLNLKETQPVAPAASSWSYSVLFRISVLEDFCSANASIAEYLRNISVFLPTENCEPTARAKILEHTFGRPSKEKLADTFLDETSCTIYMNMTRYNDASVQHEHSYLQNIFVTPEAKLEYPLPEEQAVSDIIQQAKNIDEAVKFPCRLTEVGANNTVWYERVEVVDDFVDTMTTLVNYELGPYRAFATEALECNTVFDLFGFFIRNIRNGPETHPEILKTCLCVDLHDSVLLGWGLDNGPLESSILSCVFTDDSIKRFSDDRFFGVTRRLQTRLRERVFKVPNMDIFCEFSKVDFLSVLQKRMEAILNDTPEGSPRDTLRDTIDCRISELEKTQSVYQFFAETNKRKHGEMEANATEDLIPLLASFTSSIVENSEDIALFTIHNHTAQSIRLAQYAVVGHLLKCMLSG